MATKFYRTWQAHQIMEHNSQYFINLPFATHKRFVESLTSVLHLQSDLNIRFIGFAEALKKSKKKEVQFLFNNCKFDKSCRFGQNLDFLLTEYKYNDLELLLMAKKEIKNTRVNKLHENEEWKVNLIEEISLARKGLLTLDLEEEIVEDLLLELCTN